MEPLAVTIALLATCLVGRFLYQALFQDADEFWECVGYCFKPDLLSLFRGEWFKDMGKTFRIEAFFLVTLFAGVLTYAGVMEGLRAILTG